MGGFCVGAAIFALPKAIHRDAALSRARYTRIILCRGTQRAGEYEDNHSLADESSSCR